MCLCNLRYQGIWQADSQQEKLNFICTNAQMELGLHSAASTEDSKTGFWPCSVFPCFPASAPHFLQPSLAEIPLPCVSDCQVQGVPVRKRMRRQGLPLQLQVWVSWLWQDWWGECRASLSSWSREDLLSLLSEQFHCSRFLPQDTSIMFLFCGCHTMQGIKTIRGSP